MKHYFFLLPVLILIINNSCKNTVSPESDTIEDLSTPISTISTSVKPSDYVDTLRYCVVQGNLGVEGYDLVNYFTVGSAELGVADFNSNHNGVVYHFKNDENKKSFDKNPSKYLPVYGGWCSMTLAMGRATKPTYDNFKIINDKLHLFERTLSVNGQLLWVKNPVENSTLAQKNYDDYVKNGRIENN